MFAHHRRAVDPPPVVHRSHDIVERHPHIVEKDFVEMIITVVPADRANLDAVAVHRDQYDADAHMLGMQWPGTDECIHPVGNLRLARPDLVTVDHQLVRSEEHTSDLQSLMRISY